MSFRTTKYVALGSVASLSLLATPTMPGVVAALMLGTFGAKRLVWEKRHALVRHGWKVAAALTLGITATAFTPAVQGVYNSNIQGLNSKQRIIVRTRDAGLAGRNFAVSLSPKGPECRPTCEENSRAFQAFGQRINENFGYGLAKIIEGYRDMRGMNANDPPDQPQRKPTLRLIVKHPVKPSTHHR